MATSPFTGAPDDIVRLQADAITDAEKASDLAQRLISLVCRIQARDEAATEELQTLLIGGLRWFCARQLGRGFEAENCVHDTLLIVVQAIKKGVVREPERLTGYVRTVVQQQIAQVIQNRMANPNVPGIEDAQAYSVDARKNPEQAMADREKLELIKQVLGEMTEKERNILTRYYVHQQPEDQVCKEMKLGETQFRLLKSRAKARFGELGKKRLSTKHTSRQAEHAHTLRSSAFVN